jgi:predicted O-methyltransferase YrrM
MERAVLKNLIKTVFTPKVDFNRDSLEGQLTVDERKKMYEIITEVKPDNVFEIGTWKGGGSTYIIASALLKNKKGTLYTVECRREFYDYAFTLYNGELAHLGPFVKLHFGDSISVYSPILASIERVDVLFLDGAEDDGQTYGEYLLFKDKLKTKSILMCHDWNSLKAAKLRLVLEQSLEWENIALLESGPTVLRRF